MPVHDTIRTLTVAAALTGVTGVLAGCGQDADEGATPEAPASSPTSEASSPTPGDSAPSTPSASAEPVVITIEEFAYTDPGPVAPGTEISVENLDDTAHTVTADGAGGFDLTIAPGETGTFTAPSAPGDYPFVCSFHANMDGTLVVA